MTYREAFDATGNPRKHISPRRRQLRLLARWMVVVALLMAWAHLVSYLDGQKW